ncbi:MAG: hypothetical protein QXU40_01165 [Candidatus Pacearchaeota archaeon]
MTPQKKDNKKQFNKTQKKLSNKKNYTLIIVLLFILLFVIFFSPSPTGNVTYLIKKKSAQPILLPKEVKSSLPSVEEETQLPSEEQKSPPPTEVLTPQKLISKEEEKINIDVSKGEDKIIGGIINLDQDTKISISQSYFFGIFYKRLLDLDVDGATNNLKITYMIPEKEEAKIYFYSGSTLLDKASFSSSTIGGLIPIPFGSDKIIVSIITKEGGKNIVFVIPPELTITSPSTLGGTAGREGE